ncbi:MAG TPA: hypothetical protein VME42_13965 [Steroidobacteraceae bacterium]|nr:hypothetical protein [Steroidobacteraceae bacterium]
MSSGDSKKSHGGSPGRSGSGEASAAKAPAEPRKSGEPKKQTGRVQFDERGNAVWEWSIATGAFGREVSADRMRRLENPGLSLADDAPTPFDKVKPNPQGTVKGYNPYDSGKLARTGPPPKKTDLKKLSDWLQLKKQAEKNNPDEEE